MSSEGRSAWPSRTPPVRAGRRNRAAQEVEMELRRPITESDRRNRSAKPCFTALFTAHNLRHGTIKPSWTCMPRAGAGLGVAQSAASLLTEATTELTVVSESVLGPSQRHGVYGLHRGRRPASYYVLKQKKPLSFAPPRTTSCSPPVREVMRQRGHHFISCFCPSLCHRRSARHTSAWTPRAS